MKWAETKTKMAFTHHALEPESLTLSIEITVGVDFINVNGMIQEDGILLHYLYLPLKEAGDDALMLSCFSRQRELNQPSGKEPGEK